jgi:hypothetical protein
LTETAGSGESRGLSRRAALKAGVAVGVGVAAWSGASITSLGGTPAYAQEATGVIPVNLSGGCQNTDQSSACPGGAPFRYHTLKQVSPPFSVPDNIPEGTCCDVAKSTLHWTQPPLLTCVVRVEIYANLQACKDRNQGLLVGFGENTGDDGVVGVPVPFTCGQVGIPSPANYTIFAACKTRPPP